MGLEMYGQAEFDLSTVSLLTMWQTD